MKNNKKEKFFLGMRKDLDLVLGRGNVIDLRPKCGHNGMLAEADISKDCSSMESAEKLNFSGLKDEALSDAFFKRDSGEASCEFLPNENYKPPAFSDKLPLYGKEYAGTRNKFPFSWLFRVLSFFKREKYDECDNERSGTSSGLIAREAGFFVLAIFFALSVWSLNLVEKSLGFERKISETGLSAFSDLASAASEITKGNITAGSANFRSASDKFSNIRKNLDRFGNIFLVLDRMPLPNSIGSKKALFDAGQNLSMAGTVMLGGIPNVFEDASKFSVIEAYNNAEKVLASGTGYLEKAIVELNRVDMAYVPEQDREKFISAKEKLPALKDALKNLENNGHLAMRALGMDSAKKYLFIFENNHEIRAGGGFIGTYGLMEINKGKITNFYIDDIYNPDGQLFEKIVPPGPVQRVSDAWSMHDANWFADFPTSAKKVALFYEKTGGPTVDGVIAATPVLVKKLLEMTGPINMQEYGKTVDANNFMEIAQYEVEINYDKELNRPKKFLSDLWSEMQSKVLDIDKENAVSVLEILNELLKEKQILFYSTDSETEDFIIKNGWGGQLMDVSGDYINVVNSNLGGFKTDGVINEEIRHTVEVQGDGTIIDTLEVTRYHLGGTTPYDWWNKVNVDYMRVYVPLGSQLLEAKGHTWEKPWREGHPFDYSRFKKDPDVEKIESTMFEDKATGTQIFEESGKTVFGNWVFVSPGESVTVAYKYKLPFKVGFDNEGLAKYSLYAQKQLGSAGSRFEGKLDLPDNFKITWAYPENFNLLAGNVFRMDAKLAQDKSYGVIIQKE